MNAYDIVCPDLVDQSAQRRLEEAYPPPPPPPPSTGSQFYARWIRPYLVMWVLLIAVVAGLLLRAWWVHGQRARTDLPPEQREHLHTTAPKVEL